MIKIIIQRSGKIYGIEVSGHAGYADAGSDIVCAGISVLADSLIMTAEKYYGDTGIGIDIKADEQEDGYARLEYYDRYGLLKTAFDMFCMGAEGIAEQFPYNVEIEYK